MTSLVQVIFTSHHQEYHKFLKESGCQLLILELQTTKGKQIKLGDSSRKHWADIGCWDDIQWHFVHCSEVINMPYIRLLGPWCSLCRDRYDLVTARIWHSCRAENPTGTGNVPRCCRRLGTQGGRLKTQTFDKLYCGCKQRQKVH